MRSLLVALVAMVVLAVGCAGDDDADDSPADTSAPADTSPPATDAPPATDSPSDDEPATTDPPPAVAFRFSVQGVEGGTTVPVEFTCDGANDTPAVTIESVPDVVEEIVLIVDDPDAPTDDPFVHWLVYGIAPDTTTIDDGDDTLTYGLNDLGTAEWFGPCPPPDDGPHAYEWKLFGLSSTLGLDPELDARAVETAIADVIVTESLLTASYRRSG